VYHTIVMFQMPDVATSPSPDDSRGTRPDRDTDRASHRDLQRSAGTGRGDQAHAETEPPAILSAPSRSLVAPGSGLRSKQRARSTIMGDRLHRHPTLPATGKGAAPGGGMREVAMTTAAPDTHQKSATRVDPVREPNPGRLVVWECSRRRPHQLALFHRGVLARSRDCRRTLGT
jgi:hypothetical protein